MLTESNPEKSWQTTNLESIKKRLQRLHKQPQETLFYEPSGVHFIEVKKYQSLIQLALIGQVSLTSDLVQSKLDLNDPLNLVSLSTQALILGLLWKSEPKRIYLAGLGGGRIPLVLHHYFPEALIECTEIDPNLLEVAQRFFGIQLDERLQVALQDGREYLAQQPKAVQYDLIITDAVLGSGYMPYRLATQEFYKLCKTHLVSDGVVAVNLLQRDKFYVEKLKTLLAEFQHIYICCLDIGNRVVLATNGKPLEKSEIISRAHQLQNQHKFSFPLVARAVEIQSQDEWLESVPNLERSQILTDASPPANYFDNLPSMSTVFAKVEDEHPCPCGSGKIFQHCHGS